LFWDIIISLLILSNLFATGTEAVFTPFVS
jgi:hypothetical protein